MRLVTCYLVICIMFACSSQAQPLLSFDSVSDGTVLDELFAQSHGIHIRGIGDGGPFPVIATVACTTPASSPHVLSIEPIGQCPATNNFNGWFDVSFDVEQEWVSVAAIHAQAGAISYLMAYSGPEDTDFLDQRVGNVGNENIGVAQTLRIDREVGEAQIRRVRFGAFNFDADRAAFDDLSFPNIPIPVAPLSWSLLKGRF